MNSILTTTNEADEIARAEAQVELRKARLSQSLREVGKSSENLARRLGNELRPMLVVAIAIAGAAAAIGVTMTLVRRTRSRHGWLQPEQPSTLAVAAKAAGLWAMRILARRVAQEVVSRLAETPPAPAPTRSH
jgi:hypothetical protein